MNNNSERIALDTLDSIRILTEAKMLQESVIKLGDADITNSVASFVAAAERQHEKYIGQFWQAFKYPLEIFDLSKDELPNDGEVVNVFDEEQRRWVEVDFDILANGRPAFSREGQYDYFYEFDRWTRLPILEIE